MADAPSSSGRAPAERGQLFHLFTDAVLDQGFILLDLENRVMAWNAGAERLLGYAEAEVRGMPGTVLFMPDERAAGEAEREIETVLREGRAESRRWHRRKDGTQFWGSSVVTLLRSEAGALLGFAKVIQDKTERRETEGKLRQKSANLQLLSWLTSELLAAKDVDHVVDGFYQRLTEGLGLNGCFYCRVEGRPERLRLVAHPGIEPGIADRAKQPSHHETVCGTAADGRSRFVAERIQESRDPKLAFLRELGIGAYVRVPLRTPTGLYGTLSFGRRLQNRFTAEELSLLQSACDQIAVALERQQIAAALREGEGRLRLFIEHVKDCGLFQLDPQGLVTFWNSGAERLFGYSEAEVLGKHACLLLPLEDRSTLLFDAYLAAALAEGQKEEARWLARKDGTRFWARWTTTPVRDEHGALRGFAKVLRDETERADAEERLSASEERLRLTTEAAQMFAWEVDISTHRLTLSPNHGHVLGFDLNESLPQNILFVHPEDREAVRQRYRGVLEQGQTLYAECRVINPHNQEVGWTRTAAILVGACRGKPARLLAITQNITKYKRAEEALRESREKYHRISEVIPDIIFVSRADGYCTEVNARWYEYTGRTAAGSLGWGWAEAIHPDDAVPVLASWRESVRIGTPWEGEYRLRAADGSYRWFLVRSLPCRNSAGAVTEWFGTLTDIAGRREMEARLRVSEDRFRALAEANVIGVATWDLRGRVYWANDKLLVMLGYTREELEAGQIDWWRITAPESFADTASLLCELRDTGRFEPFEKSFCRKDGSCLPVMMGGALIEGNGEGISFILDLSEIKSAEQQIRASLREKEALLKEVHHRVKNNLQVIVSLLNLQAQQIEQKEVLALFQEACNRVQSIGAIHEQLYRPESLAAAVDLTAYAKQLGAALTAFYGQGERIKVEVTSTIPVTLPVERAVPFGLLLNELLSNAFKHAYPGERQGAITVQIWQEQENTCVLEVADTGVGLPEDMDARQSRSLGLQLVHVLGSQAGGTVQIRSNADGTVVQVRFSCKDGSVEQENAK